MRIGDRSAKDILRMKSRYHFRIIIILICLFFCGFTTGCVQGPVRYKTLGHRKYATVEFTERSHPVLKVIAAPAGLITDLLVTIIETPVVIIGSVPLVFTHGGPDGSGTDNPFIGVAAFPFWYPVQLLAVTVWPQYAYQEVFGEETGIFRKKKDTSKQDPKINSPPAPP